MSEGFTQGLSGEKQGFWRFVQRQLRHSLAASTAAIFGVAASVGIFLFSKHIDDQRIYTALEFRAEWRAKDIESKIRLAASPVAATAAFVASQEFLFPGEYSNFVGRLVGTKSSMRALSWAPLVKHSERASFERVMSQTIGVSYAIRDVSIAGTLLPAAEWPEYAPIAYTELFEEHAQLYGYDLLHDAVRGALLQEARNTGQMMATPAWQPAMQSIGEPMRQLIAPVFTSTKTPDAGSLGNASRGELRGFVVGHSRIAAILEHAIADTPEIVEYIRFYTNDAKAEGIGRLVALYDPGAKQIVVRGIESWLPPQDAMEFKADFDDFGQRWTLAFAFPAPVAGALRSNLPWVSGLLTLLLTAILTLYFMYQKALHEHIAQAVQMRTQELSEANATLAEEVEERSKAERILRQQARTTETALAALPVAIIFIDTRRRIRFWSKTAERIFGYSAKEVMGRPYNLSVPDSAEEAHSYFSRVEQGEVLHNMEILCHHRDGRQLNVSFSGAPLYEDDVLIGTLGVMEDVSQRRQTENQLFQAQKMESLGQLTGGLAHDFNNLLLIVMGNTQLLRDMRANDDTVQQFGGEIMAAAERGADLVRSMLAFARRQPLRPRPVDFNTTISATTRMLRHVLGERIEVVLSLEPDSWMVNVDPTQLEASLANLATNARDAMPRGGRLNIRTQRRRLDRDYASQHSDVSEGDYMMLEVSDTGMGMAPDLMKRIFEPFFTTKEAGRGSGLGLSMVFGFIKQSGGHLNVYSEPGVGTTFRLYLPRHMGEQETAAPVDDVIVPGLQETVLAVEDDPAIRKLVERELEMLGYHCIIAENAAKALEVLESGKAIDLLFSDVVMAGKLDGLELAHIVRKRWPQIGIVLTSGFSDTNIGNDGQVAHDFRLLSKPYRRQELAQMLRAALQEANRAKAAPK